MKSLCYQPVVGQSITVPVNELFHFESEGLCRLDSGRLTLGFQDLKSNRFVNSPVEINSGEWFWLADLGDVENETSLFCKDSARLEFFEVDEVQLRRPEILNWVHRLYQEISKVCHWESKATTCRSGDFHFEPEQLFCINAGNTSEWCIVTPADLMLHSDFENDIELTHSGPLAIPASCSLMFKSLRSCDVKIVDIEDVSESLLRNSLLTAQRVLFQICIARKQRVLTEQELQSQHRLQREELELGKILSDLSKFKKSSVIQNSDGTDVGAALTALGQELDIKFKLPQRWNNSDSIDNQLSAIAIRSKVRLRKIDLPVDWWNLDIESFLAVRKDSNTPVAVINQKKILKSGSRFKFFPNESADVASIPLESTAYTFTVPFHQKSDVGLLQFVANLAWSMRKEFVWIMFFSLFTIGVSLFQPLAQKIIVEDIIPSAEVSRLFEIAVTFGLLVVVAAAAAFFQSLIAFRLTIKSIWRLQTGVMDRVLRLKPKFFREYSSGDLWNRLSMISRIGDQLTNSSFTTMLAGVFSVLFLIQCFLFSPTLAWVSLGTAIAFACTIFIQVICSRKIAVSVQELNGKMFGYSDQLVRGVGKIRIAGAEQRAMSFWCRKYSSVVSQTKKLLFIKDIGDIVVPAISTISQVAVFYLAVKMLVSGQTASAALTVGVFFAFHAAHQQLLSRAGAFAASSADLFTLFFERKLILPIINEDIEDDASNKDIRQLRGDISLKDVHFRYSKDSPWVLNGLDMEIPSGSFAAIVGPSGSGKSTILRMILGFDQPENGTVFLDSSDLSGLNLNAIRKKIGTVLQMSHLPSGRVIDIVSGQVPLKEPDVWNALRVAGMEEFIQSIPAGLLMLVGEGGGTLSGGQRQRMLIARAVAGRPRILLLDEATSALDNQTQKVVSDNLGELNVTRVVVAHRLSTVMAADRIFYIEGGAVVEQGTFSQLMQQKGKFYQLAARQLQSDNSE